jgi:hypothetical protein
MTRDITVTRPVIPAPGSHKPVVAQVRLAGGGPPIYLFPDEITDAY